MRNLRKITEICENIAEIGESGDEERGGGGGGSSSSKNQFDYKEFKQNEKIRDLENRIELDKINRERGY